MTTQEATGREGVRRTGPHPSKKLISRAAVILPEVDRRLRSAHGTASLGNKDDPLDELIYIQLSIRTREDAYSEIYNALHAQVGGDWERLLTMSPHDYLPILRRGGMAEVKLLRLRSQIDSIRTAFGRVTLSPLESLPDSEVEKFLLSLEGVGPKAARCVMMYSMNREVFPVDSHCLRVLSRLGFVPSCVDRKAAHNFMQPLVPPGLRFTLHVNLVHHGRATCTPSAPDCSSCPLIDLCPTGTGQLRLSRRSS